MTSLVPDEQGWRHPLISTPKRNFSRRHLIGISGGAIAGLALVPTAGLAIAQTPTSDGDTSGITGDPAAQELLQSSMQAMAALESFHFLIETTSGSTTIMDILEIKEIEGDIRRPYDFQTTVSATLFMGTIDITAIGVDGMIVIEDPTSSSGGWIDLGTDSSTMSLLNPDYLFLSAVQVLQNAALAGEESFEDEEARVVTGTVTFPDLGGLVEDENFALPTELSSEPVDVTIWINEENLILGVEFVGAVLAGESANLARLITFSAFNDPVEIETPEL